MWGSPPWTCPPCAISPRRGEDSRRRWCVNMASGRMPPAGACLSCTGRLRQRRAWPICRLIGCWPIATAGIPVPGGTFQLVDEDGHAFDGEGLTGELVYYGPNVMMGYSFGREGMAKAIGRDH